MAGELHTLRGSPTLLIAACALLALAMQELGNWLPLNDWAYDSGQRWVRRAAPADLRIVAIDAQSLQRVGRWPWPRSTQARLIDAVCQAKPLAVGLDIANTEPAPGDAELAAAMRRCGVVVLPVLLEQGQGQHAGDWLATRPLPEFVAASRGLGRVGFDLGAQGLVRGVHLQAGIGQQSWPLLVQRVLEIAHPFTAHSTTAERPGMQTTGERTGAPHRSGERLLNFWGPPGTLPSIPAWQVLDGSAAPQLHGKMVLLGATAPGLGDLLPVPNANGQLMAGVELLGTLLLDMRQGILVRPLGLWTQTVFTLVLALLPWLWLTRFSAALGLVMTWLWAALVFVAAAWAAPLAAIWFAPTGAIAGAVFGQGLWMMRNLQMARRHLDAQFHRLGTLLQPQQRALPRRLHLQQRIALIEQAQERMLDVQKQREDALRFIAHDVRAPLSAAAHMLNGPPLDAKEQGRLSRQIQRAHQLAEAFLMLSRAENPAPLVLHPIELGGLLDQAADAIAEAAQRQGVQLRRDIEPEPAWILGDFALLERAAINLLLNAVQHSPEGGSVTIGMRQNAGQITFWVQDEGPGLDAGQRAQLFQRHVRPETQSGRSGGFGLGLYFVRLVAARHKGEAGVDSAPGRGARFWMRLPAEHG